MLTQAGSPLESPSGFRRRFRVTPRAGHVCSEVEDDFHRMRVVLHHQHGVVTHVDSEMIRAPWSTCPGAPLQLAQTFTGVALNAFAARGEKRENCTHLHDLALLAAAHALDAQPLVYDVRVSDPVEGRRRAEVRLDGETVLTWLEAEFRIIEPAAIAGQALTGLRAWIDSLDPPRQEAARLLRWGNIMARGRQIPLAKWSDASRMPPNCYTFQPERKKLSQFAGTSRDFSSGDAQPLEDSPEVQPSSQP